MAKHPVPEPNPGGGEEATGHKDHAAGGHAAAVGRVMHHAEKHGTTAHHEKSGIDHGFPSFGASHGGEHEGG